MLVCTLVLYAGPQLWLITQRKSLFLFQTLQFTSSASAFLCFDFSEPWETVGTLACPILQRSGSWRDWRLTAWLKNYVHKQATLLTVFGKCTSGIEQRTYMHMYWESLLDRERSSLRWLWPSLSGILGRSRRTTTSTTCTQRSTPSVGLVLQKVLHLLSLILRHPDSHSETLSLRSYSPAHAKVTCRILWTGL